MLCRRFIDAQACNAAKIIVVSVSAGIACGAISFGDWPSRIYSGRTECRTGLAVIGRYRIPGTIMLSLNLGRYFPRFLGLGAIIDEIGHRYGGSAE